MKKIFPEKMDGNLSQWEEDIIEHFYNDLERAEICEDIKRFKQEYYSIYDEFPFDRIMLAVYKYGKSKRDKLSKALELAKVDWRDLLVAAKFANNVEAHNNWKAELMSSIESRKAHETSKE